MAELEKYNIDQAKRFLERNMVKDYIINPDGTFTIYGKLDIDLSRFDIHIKEVTGNFSLRKKQLDKLPQCPERVGWNVLININNLTSLVGLPKFINGSLYMMYNKLDHSEENFEILYNTYIGVDIEGDEDFMLAYNRYKTIKDIVNS